jgi:hypothetical protein
MASANRCSVPVAGTEGRLRHLHLNNTIVGFDRGELTDLLELILQTIAGDQMRITPTAGITSRPEMDDLHPTPIGGPCVWVGDNHHVTDVVALVVLRSPVHGT